MIYLLSEEIQTGKTTSLQLCTENRYDIGGFLGPDKNGMRFLMNLESKKEIPFEIDITDFEGPIKVIGKYSISKAAFDQAAVWVKEHLQSSKIKFVVIDEVGKLELAGKGFASTLEYALENIGDKHLILVVRNSLHDEIVEKFGLQKASRLTKNGIDKLLSSK